MTRFLLAIGWISLVADLLIIASIISAQKGDLSAMNKILDMAAEFERRAKTPTNLMTMEEFLFVVAALRRLDKLEAEQVVVREVGYRKIRGT